MHGTSSSVFFKVIHIFHWSESEISQCIYLYVQVSGGREGRPIGAYELAKAVEELGAGEILLNCIDCDGNSSLFITFVII
jgi:imidazole glycerol phosphate synthase subunit HisF